MSEDYEAEGQGEKQEPGEENSQVMALAFQVSFIIMLAAYLCKSIYSPSFFGHLAKGDWILSGWRVPTIDIWTVVGQGKALLSANWLFDALLSVIDSLGGDGGLVSLKLLFFFLFIFVLANLFSYASKSRFIGTLIAAMVSCGVLVNASFDSSIVGWMLFAAVLELACRYREASSKKNILIILFVVGALYANLHESAFLALMVASVLVCYSENSGKAKENARLKAWLFVGVFLLSQVVSPYLGKQFLANVIRYRTLAVLDFGYQLHPSIIFNYSVAFLVLLWILLALFLHYRPQAFRVSELLLTSLFAVLAMASTAFIPFALIITGLHCVSVWGRSDGEALGNIGTALLKLQSSIGKLTPKGVLWVIICATIVSFQDELRAPVVKGFLPTKEVDYLLENKIEFPLLHEAAIGPYLLYRFSSGRDEPVRRVASTPSSLMLNPSFALGEAKMRDLSLGWEDYASFISPRSILCRSDSALYSMLAHHRNWLLVFENGEAFPKVLTEEESKRNPLYHWAVFVARDNVE